MSKEKETEKTYKPVIDDYETLKCDCGDQYYRCRVKIPAQIPDGKTELKVGTSSFSLMFWKYAEGRIVVYAQHCSASKIGFRWVTSSRPGSLSHINWTIQKPSESIYTTSHKPKELGTYFEDSQEFRIVLDLCDWDIPTEKKHSGKFLEILSNDEKTMDFTLTSNDQIDTPIHSLILKLVSPYFAKAIESPVGGGSKNRLYIDFPLMVASAIKEFAYHGKVTPVSIEAALFLIEAAHQWELSSDFLSSLEDSFRFIEMKNLRKAYSAILFAVKLEWGSSQRECILRLQKTLECQISFLAVDFIRELIQAGPTMDAKVDPAAETHKRKMTEPLESSSKKQCVTPSVVSVASVASVAVVDKPRVLLS